MNAHDEKRLFFGIETTAPWPDHFPDGRLLDEAARHITLAFLGNVSYSKVDKLLPAFPAPPFQVGSVGKFDSCLLLPNEKWPRVVAWHVNLFENDHPLLGYQKKLIEWLKSQGFEFKDETRPLLPHVTLCRKPFNPKQWQKAFTPLPVALQNIHLYESLGNLKYESRWKLELKPPFEEIEHTADIAFCIRGETFSQLRKHAQIALAFKFPPLLAYFPEILDTREKGDVEDIVILLNDLIGKADADIGCPFKAVSFHGNIQQEEEVLRWEMIVDV